MKDFGLKLTPFNIAMFYACIGGIWLVFVITRILNSLFHEPAAIELLEINNAVFIIFTASLLYLLIRQSEAGIKQRKLALTRLNRSLRAYSECHQALIRGKDETSLMQNICRIIVEVGGYRVAWVGVAQNDDERTIIPVAQFGDENGYLKDLKVSWSNTDRGKGPTGTAIRSGKTVVARFIQYDPKWELWRERAIQHGFLSSISLPLVERHHAFAALVIFAGEPDAFDEEEVKLLSELADDLSYGITTLRNRIAGKTAEKERRLLASVIEQACEGIFLFDSDGVVQYINPAVTAITGRLSEDMIGKHIELLEHREPNKGLCTALLSAIADGKDKAGKFVYKRKDGVTFEIDLTIWTVSDSEGNVISYAALLRDISHEMQLERQLRQAQRMESIGTLAGGIAHDFNNSLASIITCAEMALDEVTQESPLSELLEVILKSGLRGKNLVRQILTFSRQVEQEQQEVEVDLIVKECLKLLRSSIPPSIEIRLNLDQEPGVVLADPTQIHQIVMNLCTNAVHAMRGQPNGVMEIWLENIDFDSGLMQIGNLKAGSYLCLTVKDSGHGMDVSTIERIYDPFFSTKGQSEGTGLGLSVIHGIVANLGGAITVASEPGKGAEFMVYLPRLPINSRMVKVDKRPFVTAGKERILLVDDEEDVVFSTRRMLTQLGYEVVSGTDPCKALQLFRSQPYEFDLVITDHTMPGMSGTELAREMSIIRADIPVILCTGYDLPLGNADEDEAVFSCIREIAMKPLERGELALLIRRVMEDTDLKGDADVKSSYS